MTYQRSKPDGSYVPKIKREKAEDSESSEDEENKNLDITQFIVKLTLTFNETSIKNMIIGYHGAYYIQAYLTMTTQFCPKSE